MAIFVLWGCLVVSLSWVESNHTSPVVGSHDNIRFFPLVLKAEYKYCLISSVNNRMAQGYGAYKEINNYLYAVSSLTRSIAITVLGSNKDSRVLRESGRILQPVKQT